MLTSGRFFLDHLEVDGLDFLRRFGGRRLIGLQAELGLPDLDDVIGLQNLAHDGLAVDQGATLGAVVDDGHLVAFAEDLAVVAQMDGSVTW